jgi:hypothetical protein
MTTSAQVPLLVTLYQSACCRRADNQSVRRGIAVLLGITLAAAFGTSSAAERRAGSEPCRGCWVPPQRNSWQWQLQGHVDRSVHARVFDIDMFDNGARVVRALHHAGRRVICYIDAGTWENWRPDAGMFPKSVRGKPNGWPGERWLDIRRLDVLRPIIGARVEKCAHRGYDSAEFDNVDGYANETGFPLTAGDQLEYNEWLANAAHRHGLSAALKNDLGQVHALLPYFDFALDEQCFQYRECSRLLPFVKAGKAVFEVEYKLPRSMFCTKADQFGFNSMRKRLSLKAWRRPCPQLDR